MLRIRDSGAGDANPLAGAGLRGLADHGKALSGNLELDGQPSHRTLLTARNWCDSRVATRSRAIQR
jgi:glucose-6-phosphate-specific signal transduction histidine kinase